MHARLPGSLDGTLVNRDRGIPSGRRAVASSSPASLPHWKLAVVPFTHGENLGPSLNPNLS